MLERLSTQNAELRSQLDKAKERLAAVEPAGAAEARGDSGALVSCSDPAGAAAAAEIEALRHQVWNLERELTGEKRRGAELVARLDQPGSHRGAAAAAAEEAAAEARRATLRLEQDCRRLREAADQRDLLEKSEATMASRIRTLEREKRTLEERSNGLLEQHREARAELEAMRQELQEAEEARAGERADSAKALAAAEAALEKLRASGAAGTDGAARAEGEAERLRRALRSEELRAEKKTQEYCREVAAACDEAFAVARAAEGRGCEEASAASSQADLTE